MKLQPDITIELVPEYGNLVLIRRVVHSLSEWMGFCEKDCIQLEMAVDEACANSVASMQAKEGKTTQAKLRIEIAVHDHCLILAIIDTGNNFLEHYEKACAFHEGTERTRRRGYGLQIIKTFMDEVHYIHEPEIGNKLILTKYLTNS